MMKSKLGEINSFLQNHPAIMLQIQISSYQMQCFFNNPTDVGNLISGSSAFSKPSLNIWKFTVHILLKRCDKSDKSAIVL